MSDFEDSEFEYLTPLKDLSKHVWHGRVWLHESRAEPAMAAVRVREGVADTLMWHDWFENSRVTYELQFSSTTREGIAENLKIVLDLDSAAMVHIAYKRCGEIIEFRDWQTFTK